MRNRIPWHDEYLYENEIKRDIYAERLALTALFSCKNEIFRSLSLRVFVKNAIRTAMDVIEDIQQNGLFNG